VTARVIKLYARRRVVPLRADFPAFAVAMHSDQDAVHVYVGTDGDSRHLSITPAEARRWAEQLLRLAADAEEWNA
jgi:hypothetical protein